jgi:hypothetical protein
VDAAAATAAAVVTVIAELEGPGASTELLVA